MSCTLLVWCWYNASRRATGMMLGIVLPACWHAVGCVVRVFLGSHTLRVAVRGIYGGCVVHLWRLSCLGIDCGWVCSDGDITPMETGGDMSENFSKMLGASPSLSLSQSLALSRSLSLSLSPVCLSVCLSLTISLVVICSLRLPCPLPLCPAHLLAGSSCSSLPPFSFSSAFSVSSSSSLCLPPPRSPRSPLS
eukprot:2364952-Rhodomonas_salina.2